MEWVKIVHPRVRDVFVDGNRSGTTNTVLIVSKGHHRFDLGVPKDYAPRRRRVPVSGTSSLAPLEIHFGPDDGATA